MFRSVVFPVILFFYIIPFNVMSQNNLSGEYSLTGIHEMASGFLFKEDKTFEFYYVYGAVDRIAKGTYEEVGDTIKLKSDKAPGQDFEIKMQKKQGNGCRLAFKAPNVFLLNNIKAFCFKGEERFEFETDKDGIIDIPQDHFDKIYVQHLLFPDIVTQIKDETNENNYFEMALKPSLSEVSFKGIDLIRKEDELIMLPNYFMPFERIVYRKSE